MNESVTIDLTLQFNDNIRSGVGARDVGGPVVPGRGDPEAPQAGAPEAYRNKKPQSLRIAEETISMAEDRPRSAT